MKDRFIDIGRIMDEVFSAAENFSSFFNEDMDWKGPHHHGMGKKFHWNENADFYPAYMFPPSNIYMTEDKSIIFEFALAGYKESDINLEFKGDYMLFSAKVNEDHKEEENVRYFKRRLKFKDIDNQRYYVPEDKFDREGVKASFRNGILKVSIPPKDKVDSGNTIKVDIEGEE